MRSKLLAMQVYVHPSHKKKNLPDGRFVTIMSQRSNGCMKHPSAAGRRMFMCGAGDREREEGQDVSQLK